MLTNTKNKINEYRYPIYTFLIVSLVWLLMYSLNHIFPFGNDIFLNSDLRDQYLPFIKSLKNIIYNKESIFFTWNMSSGQDFFTNLCYYMSSPLNWLVLLTPNNYEGYFLNILTIIRMGLMGFTCALLIKKTLNINNFSTTIFSCIYPLGGFISIYSTNIIWHDSFWIFPIVIINLIDLINNNKKSGYIFWLSLLIVSNFYIAFIMCIALFFIFILLNNEYKNINKNITFILTSILSALIASIIIIPTLPVIFSGNNDLPISLISIFDNFSSIFKAFFIHTEHIYFTTEYQYAPLFCTLGLLTIFPHFLFAKSIKLKDKICITAMVGIILFSTNFALFNFVLNGFHLPIGIPNRFIFLLTLIFIIVGIKIFNEEIEIDFKISLLYQLLISFILFTTNLSIELKLLNLILIFIYNILFFLNKKKMFLLILLIETIIMSLIFISPLHENKTENITIVSENLNNLTVNPTEQIATFSNQMINIGYYNNINSYDGFSSMLNPRYRNLIKLGLGTDDNRMVTIGFTDITASLFGIKYFVQPSFQKPTTENFNLIHEIEIPEDEGVSIYENQKNVSKIHLFNEDILNYKLTNDVFENFNNLSKILLNDSSVNIYNETEIPLNIMDSKKEIQYKNNSMIPKEILKYNFSTNLTPNTKYALLSNVKAPGITISNTYTENNFDFSRKLNNWKHLNFYYMNINQLNVNETENTNIEFTSYRDSPRTRQYNTDENLLNPIKWAIKNEEIEEHVLKYLDNSKVKNAKITSNKITISNIENKGILTISTLYSPGWKVYVNGEKTELLEIMDLFIGVKVNKGDKVEFKYTTPYFYTGLAITSIALFVFVLVLQKEKVINIKLLENIINKITKKKAS